MRYQIVYCKRGWPLAPAETPCWASREPPVDT